MGSTLTSCQLLGFDVDVKVERQLLEAMDALARHLTPLVSNWAIVGGCALKMQGVPRETDDVDIVVRYIGNPVRGFNHANNVVLNLINIDRNVWSSVADNSFQPPKLRLYFRALVKIDLIHADMTPSKGYSMTSANTVLYQLPPPFTTTVRCFTLEWLLLDKTRTYSERAQEFKRAKDLTDAGRSAKILVDTGRTKVYRGEPSDPTPEFPVVRDEAFERVRADLGRARRTRAQAAAFSQLDVSYHHR